jgi:hypothetical protein
MNCRNLNSIAAAAPAATLGASSSAQCRHQRAEEILAGNVSTEPADEGDLE